MVAKHRGGGIVRNSTPISTSNRGQHVPERSEDEDANKKNYFSTKKKSLLINVGVVLLLVFVLFQVLSYTTTNTTTNNKISIQKGTHKTATDRERRDQQITTTTTTTKASAPAEPLDSTNFYNQASSRAITSKQSGPTATTAATTNSSITHVPAKKLKVNYPIFVASFSKSGTTSTFFAFSCYLGIDYVAHRWTNSIRNKGGAPELIGRCVEVNVDHRRPPFDGCGINTTTNTSQTVVWSDTSYIGGPHGCYHPNLDALEEIWDAYPHATLLLVRRNATAWYHSANTKRASFIPKWTSQCPQMPNQRKESVWVEFYNNYTDRVRQFAKQRQGQMTYVEVELEDPNTGKVLEDQVGLPRSCWKHCPSSFAAKECSEIQQHQK